MRRFCQLAPAIVRYQTCHPVIIASTRMGSSSSKSFSPKNLPGSCAKVQKAKTPEQSSSGESSKMATPVDEYIEAVVCNTSDLQDNEMKSLELGPGGPKVLVVKQGGQVSAVGAKCTHYGAPLASGALGEGRVRCPWHGACFNIRTGDIEDYPGLDSLPCYQVNVGQDGSVKVRAKKSDLDSNVRVKTCLKRSSTDNSTYLVVGGGPSAAAFVETLRQNNCAGRIVMIAKENAVPYDRVKVSKALDADIQKLQLRSDEFYAQNDIEVYKGVEVTKVNTEKKTVSLSDGESLRYTKLYIATGSKSRLLPIVGNDLKNVFTLRTLADGGKIHSAIGNDKDKHIVILGVSFIGMEAAAYCVGKAKSITVIGRDNVPFLPVFGEAVGMSLMKLFQEKGVQFQMNNNIKACHGKNGVLTSVELNDCTSLPADVLLMGVGSLFNTSFLKDSGIAMEQNGSIPVNDRLRTNLEGVYAGGDIAYAPIYSHGGTKGAIGHFGLAHYHGRVAALNMLNIDTPLKSVPFFWTMVFGKSVRYCGYGRHHSVRIEGDVNALKFVAFYFDVSGRVISMASCQRDPVVAQFAELLAQGKSLHSDDLLQDPFAWTKTYLDC